MISLRSLLPCGQATCEAETAGGNYLFYTSYMAVVSVDMWMDFGCPWSRMAFIELQRAVEVRGDTLDIHFHGLRLDPGAPSDYGKTTIENLCEHLSISEAEAESMLQKVVDAGRDIGVGFNFHTARGASTLDTHRLLKYSHIYGVQSQLALVLWRAHFENGALISDHSVLMPYADEVGLPTTSVREVLDTNQCGDEVLAGEKDAVARGIERTPHFLFSHGVELSGMQYAPDFQAVLA